VISHNEQLIVSGAGVEDGCVVPVGISIAVVVDRHFDAKGIEDGSKIFRQLRVV
jgi:hypothetical protein